MTLATHPAPARFNPRHTPLETVEPSEHRQTQATPERAECPTCEKTFVGAAIARGDVEPRFGAAAGSYWRMRAMYCDHCNHVIVWQQACDVTGEHLGEKLGEHGIIKGHADVARFLKTHPEAAGVAQ